MIIVGLDCAILSDGTDLEHNVVSLTKAELDLAYLRRAGVAADDIEGLMGIDAVAVRRLDRSLWIKLSAVNSDDRERVITILLERDAQLPMQLNGAYDVLPLDKAAVHSAARAEAAIA